LIGQTLTAHSMLLLLQQIECKMNNKCNYFSYIGVIYHISVCIKAIVHWMTLI